MAQFQEGYRSRAGVNYSTTWRRRFREEHGFWPHRTGGDWISPASRRKIYDRDGWTCYLCGDVLSGDTLPNTPKSLTLDHIKPRSLGGSDDPSNLATCCRECNSAKGAKFEPGGALDGW